MGLVGVTELSDAQKKQLKEQQEVRPWGAGQAGSEGLVEYRLPPCPVVQWSRVFFLCLPVPGESTVRGEALGQVGPPSMASHPLRALPSPQLGPEPSHAAWAAFSADAPQLLPTALAGWS